MAYEKKPGSREETVDPRPDMHRILVSRDDSAGKGYDPEDNLLARGYVINEELTKGKQVIWEAPIEVSRKQIAEAELKSQKRISQMDSLDTTGLPIGASVKQVENSVTLVADEG